MRATHHEAPAGPFWRESLAPYARSQAGRAIVDLTLAVVPYAALSVLMYLALDVSQLLVLAIAVPAAGFLLRTYMVFHDCAHGSWSSRLLQDSLTKAERALVQAGKDAEVLHLRRTFQEAMRLDLISAVERLTEGNVRAFMSANHIAPDTAAEIFLMDRDVHAADAGMRTGG